MKILYGFFWNALVSAAREILRKLCLESNREALLDFRVDIVVLSLQSVKLCIGGVSVSALLKVHLHVNLLRKDNP